MLAVWGIAIKWIDSLSRIVFAILFKLEEDKKALARTDVQDALLQLLHLLREWQRAAQLTNWLLMDWLDKGKPGNYEQLNNAISLQYHAVEHVLYATGYPSLHHDLSGKKKPKKKRKGDRTMLTALFVYAPEIEWLISQIIDQRLDLLTQLREEIETKADPSGLNRVVKRLTNDSSVSVFAEFTPTELQKFQDSLERLEELNNRIAFFIADNFALKDVTVEDISEIKRAAKIWGRL